MCLVTICTYCSAVISIKLLADPVFPLQYSTALSNKDVMYEYDWFA
jgi:hypothetical protein